MWQWETCRRPRSSLNISNISGPDWAALPQMAFSQAFPGPPGPYRPYQLSSPITFPRPPEKDLIRLISKIIYGFLNGPEIRGLHRVKALQHGDKMRQIALPGFHAKHAVIVFQASSVQLLAMFKFPKVLKRFQCPESPLGSCPRSPHPPTNTQYYSITPDS